MKDEEARRVAKKVQDVAKRLVQEKREKLGKVSVESRPMNGHGTMIQLSFMAPGLTEERKALIRELILENGFKAEVQPLVRKLGWSNFRISACPRQRSITDYCWLIQQRPR